MQVSGTISTCSLHLRHIGLIHRYLTQPTAERVLIAMVTSRLGYCNSLLFETSANNIGRLQPLALLLVRLVVNVCCLFFANCTGYPFSSVLHSKSLCLCTRCCTKTSRPSTRRSSYVSTSQPDVFALLTLARSLSRDHAAEPVTIHLSK